MRLTTQRITELQKFILAAKDPKDTPWALIEAQVADWFQFHGDDLLADLSLLFARNAADVRAVITEMRERLVNHGQHTSPTLEAWADRIESALGTKVSLVDIDLMRDVYMSKAQQEAYARILAVAMTR